MFSYLKLISFSCSIPFFLLSVGFAQTELNQVPKERILIRTVKLVDGKRVQFIKYRNSDNQIIGASFDDRGQYVEILEGNRKDLIRPSLRKKLAEIKVKSRDAVSLNDNEKIEVILVLDENIPSEREQGIFNFKRESNGTFSVYRNDTLISDSILEEEREKNRPKKLREAEYRLLLVKSKVDKLKAKFPFLNNWEHGKPVALDVEEIEALKTEPNLLAGIEIPAKYSDLQATGNEWKSKVRLDVVASQSSGGLNSSVMFIESGCPDNGTFQNYTKLGGSYSAHSVRTVGLFYEVAPNATVRCRSNLIGSGVLPSTNETYGYPELMVLNRSFGANTYGDYRVDDRNSDDWIYNTGKVIFNAAGNNGDDIGEEYVESPGLGLNVITVGGYNPVNNNIYYQSSFLNPNSKNQKPELVLPAENIYAPSTGQLHHGTSYAAPIGAGLAADLFNIFPSLKYGMPDAVKAFYMAGGFDIINETFTQTGIGGVNMLSLGSYSDGWSWRGSNSSWSQLQLNDGSAYSNYIGKGVFLVPGGDAFVAISWLNRGTYTYSHINDPHPIGMDLDLTVLDPNGNWVASSASWDNGYEVVRFTPYIQGYYKVRINRYANRDTQSWIYLTMVAKQKF